MRALGHASGALAAGWLFGVGLIVSGMTQPQKVLDFLDLTEDHDPSLALVMLAAISVHSLAYRWKAHLRAPLFGSAFAVPTRVDIDAKLLVGAAIFGLGWGLGGYCPGPGIVALASGGSGAAAFVAAMLMGMWLTTKVEHALGRHIRGIQGEGHAI